MFEAPADALVYHDPAVNMEHLKHAGEAQPNPEFHHIPTHIIVESGENSHPYMSIDINGKSIIFTWCNIIIDVAMI